MWKLVLELRRRRIFRTAGFYIVGAWVFLQVSDLVFPALDISESAIRFVWLGVILVSPLALIFAWFYDVGSNGILRTPPADKAADTDLRLRRSDYLLLLALLAITVAIGYRISTEIGEMKTAETAGYAPVELDDNSIVVLPLRNISEDDTQLYFVDGMHEALIADLSRIRALKVISRTSSLQYRDTEKSLSEIGRELGAAKVVEGSVYRVGDEVRITIQLIDTRSDKLNWSGSYERELVDILELQREVGGAIAAEIEVLLTTEEQAFLASPRQVDPEAYENYLKGRFHWYEFTPKDLELASQYFQAALDIDPGYALAYVGYADALATLAHIGQIPPTEAFPRAIGLIEKALEIDDKLAEAHDLSARIKFTWDHDWAGAEQGFRESIRLKPSQPDAHIVYSQFLGITGKLDLAVAEAQKALTLDPLNTWPRLALGSRLAWSGRYDEALELNLQLAADHPGWPAVYRNLSDLHYYRGEFRDSLEAMAKYYELSDQPELARLVAGYDGGSDFSGAVRALAERLADTTAESYVSDYEIARIFAFAGDKKHTLEWLERAHENRDTQLVYSIAEPLFALVWDDPRYELIKRELNLLSYLELDQVD